MLHTTRSLSSSMSIKNRHSSKYKSKSVQYHTHISYLIPLTLVSLGCLLLDSLCCHRHTYCRGMTHIHRRTRLFAVSPTNNDLLLLQFFSTSHQPAAVRSLLHFFLCNTTDIMPYHDMPCPIDNTYSRTNPLLMIDMPFFHRLKQIQVRTTLH